MEVHARAAVDVYDRVLRYAEVEQYGSRYRLLRLGSCDFDFNVADELILSGKGANLETVREALGDVYAGSVASTLSVTIHPPTCLSYFSPYSAESSPVERDARLNREAVLLNGSEASYHVATEPVRTQELASGGVVNWMHVLTVDESVNQCIGDVVQDLPQSGHRLVVGMQAAAATMGHLQRWTPANAGRGDFAIAIGWYAGHVEYTLCNGEDWYFSKHTEAVPAVDVAYFTIAMLNHLGLRPVQVRRLYVYGNDVDLSLFSDLEVVFELEAHRLNPLAVLDLDPGSLSSDFEVEAYVGCIGAAL